MHVRLMLSSAGMDADCIFADFDGDQVAFVGLGASLSMLRCTIAGNNISSTGARNRSPAVISAEASMFTQVLLYSVLHLAVVSNLNIASAAELDVSRALAMAQTDCCMCSPRKHRYTGYVSL